MNTINKQLLLEHLHKKMERFEGEKQRGVAGVIGSIESGKFDTTGEAESLREALEWYANPYNYSTENLSKHGYILIDEDGGKKAREALGKNETNYATAGECAWCGEIASELRKPHIYDRAPNGGRMCRSCWDHDREMYKGAYGDDIGPFSGEEAKSQ